MKCPFCDYDESKVVDSRPVEEGTMIRRRRECIRCAKRFTTYERIENIPLIVVKKGGQRVPFDKNKILNGMIKACEKRPVPIDNIQRVVDLMEKELYQVEDKEVQRVPFDKNKILNGMIKACEKRPVPIDNIQRVVDLMEKELYQVEDKEVESSYIGERVMDALKDIDQVAYVRFASVYREFKDVESFMDELNRLMSER